MKAYIIIALVAAAGLYFFWWRKRTTGTKPQVQNPPAPETPQNTDAGGGGGGGGYMPGEGSIGITANTPGANVGVGITPPSLTPVPPNWGGMGLVNLGNLPGTQTSNLVDTMNVSTPTGSSPLNITTTNLTSSTAPVSFRSPFNRTLQAAPNTRITL